MDDIIFETEVSAETDGYRKSPKLVIQPLVENAVKYATDKVPVWRITIKAQTGGDGGLSVMDNGNGFQEEKIQH